MRIFAVETIYRSKGSRSPGVDDVVISKDNLLTLMDSLKRNSLLQYKASPIRRVFIPKKNGKMRPLGIPTIYDRLVQTLFVQVIEPVIDVHADFYSFGYRKGRNAHQAIGELSRILYTHNYGIHSNKSQDGDTKRYFNHTKHILSIDIKGFFDNVDHSFLLQHYPFPKSFKFILEMWLKSPIQYQNLVEQNFTGFPQGSVIGPSLANFTLNGLEKLMTPTQATRFDEDKHKHIFKTEKVNFNKGNSRVRKAVRNRVIRYADDFVVISNDHSELVVLKDRIISFLKERGLQVNEDKTKQFV